MVKKKDRKNKKKNKITICHNSLLLVKMNISYMQNLKVKKNHKIFIPHKESERH